MSVQPDLDVSLSSRQRSAFAAQALRLGHDPDALWAGESVSSHPVIRSVAGARSLLPVTPEQRAWRQDVFFSPEIAVRRAIGQGVHDRLEAAVFAAGEIDLGDEAGAARHFPFPARATSVLRCRVPAGECWDLSVRGAEFGVDDFDDVLVLVNVGELVLEPGASVVVRGNLLVLVVQRLVSAPLAGTESDCHLAVLGTPFSVDPRRNRVQAANGSDGVDGLTGRNGVAADVVPTFIGPRLVGPVAPGVADGAAGSDGTAASDGASGASGGPSKLADITIGQLVGSMVLFAGAGAGLDGGRGGRGGVGGVGGAGAPAVGAVGQFVPAGWGGDGGVGGDGGRGGRGGSGGISSNLFVTVPPDQLDRVRVDAAPSRGGRGGTGGPGGAGGLGGTGEPAGVAGEGGRTGSPGQDGRSRPAPPVFVNESQWRPS